MIGFMGYNFSGDKNALDLVPTSVNNLSSTQIEHGIYDHLSISKDVTTPYSTVIPKFNYDTILDCDFNGNISGGNIKISLGQLNSIRIKRREKNSFKWVTIKEVMVKSQGDLSFVTIDSFVPSGEDFEWAIVPVIEGVEGNYVISTLKTQFNGIFISDVDTIFKLYSGTAYSNDVSNVSVGSVKPFGSRYPIINSNGITDYEDITIQGDLLGGNYEKTRIINRNEVVKQKEVFNKFMKNGKSKIVKDWNGNIWILILTSGITYSSNPSFGMGTLNASFSMTEQGKYNDQRDLYDNGLVEVIQ